MKMLIERPTITEKLQNAVYSAIVKVLRQLIRILLRNDIPYGTYADLAKWVYVDVASREFGIPGRKTTDSRVSVITGISRKEVKRMREHSAPVDLGTSDRYNRAARVISGWLNDSTFCDWNGNPLELPFEGMTASFSTLVKDYGGDVPARAVRDELSRVGVIEEKDGKIKLKARGYIVKEGDVEKLAIMGSDVSELISTIHHNIVSDPKDAFLQRKVSYDNIPENSYEELKQLIYARGKGFVESMDRDISRYDRDVNPAVSGEGRISVGIGVFYFENPVDEIRLEEDSP
jgi:hypothetical protein